MIYSADLDPHGVNVLYAYADSAFTAPRSQGAGVADELHTGKFANYHLNV